MNYTRVFIISICLICCLLIPSWSESNQPFAAETAKHSLNPSLKYPDLESFQKAIGQPAILLKSDHIYFFAPKVYEAESNIIFPYLIRAYNALKKIVGVDTEYIIVVYTFPKGHKDAFGGTSNCTLWYDDSNLQLNNFEEWKRYRVPHVSGYIEEIAHNFVSGTKAQFGWEMVGWSIGIKVSNEVAGNPYFAEQVLQTRREQQKTFERYLTHGFTFPSDIESNLVDRIHAELLWQSEKKYGSTFYQDFFTEIRKQKKELDDAIVLSKGDDIRNKRYQITLDCFDRLPGLKFKQMLEQNGISMTVDIKSLHPTDPGWNRKLR
jgi:hypothetical protein